MGRGAQRGLAHKCSVGSLRAESWTQRGTHHAPPDPAAGRRSHRLLRWPPFFFFFFLGGGDVELLDQCLVLSEKGRRGGTAVRGREGPARTTPRPLHPLRGALTCTPGARGSRRPGSRSPPGCLPRQRVRTPGPARRPRAAAGSPPRCRRQGRSAPAPAGGAFPLPLSQCSASQACSVPPPPPQGPRSRGCGRLRGLRPRPLKGQAGILGTQRGVSPPPQPQWCHILRKRSKRTASFPLTQPYPF